MIKLLNHRITFFAKRKFVAVSLMLIQSFISNSQIVSDNLSWVSTNSVQSATSPSFGFCNGQVSYTIASTIGFYNVSVAGNPNYTTGMVTPAYIFDPSPTIPMLITFSQPVCNLRIRFCDLDGGQNEYLSALSTPYTGLSDVVGHFSGNGSVVNSSIDDAKGWVEWAGPITNLSFNYNRPGPGCGLIIDSILFDCCTPPCQAPNPGTSTTLSICSNGASTDLFPLLGSGASVSGTWTGPTGTAVTMPYDPVTMDPGTYTYSVDSNGCDSSAVVIITEITLTVIAAPTDITCHGLSNGSVVFTVANATTYSLNGGPQTPIPTPFALNGLDAGTYGIIVYNANGCTGTESFTIGEPSAAMPLITSVSPDQVVCSGITSTLAAIGSGGSLPYTFTWFTNNGVVGIGSTLNVTATQTTQYGVVLIDACGSMSDTSFVTIVIPQPIIPLLVPDDAEGCARHHVVFSNITAGPGNIVSNTIDFGDGSPVITTNALDTFSHTYEHTGVYTVSIVSVSDTGCTYVNTFQNMITVYDEPIADFNISPNPTTIFETHIELDNTSSAGVVSYSWSIPGAEPNQSSLENMSVDLPEGIVANYDVTLVVTDERGCIDSVTKIIQVLSDVIVYAPNAFTPDGDEFNQTWFLYIDGIDIQQFNLQIFDRWGEVIWESNDPQGRWDGTYQGKIVQDGLYNWILKTKELVSDKKYTFNGYINVMR